MSFTSGTPGPPCPSDDVGRIAQEGITGGMPVTLAVAAPMEPLISPMLTG